MEQSTSHHNELPFNVTIDRIVECVKDLGFHHVVITHRNGDQVEIPWPHHDLIISFDEDFGKVLHVEATMPGRANLSRVNEIAQTISQWNAERVGPNAHLTIDNSGYIRVSFHCLLNVDLGANTAQIKSFLNTAAGSINTAVNHFMELHPELLIVNAINDTDLDFTDHLANEVPEEVVLTRVRACLADLGIEKTQGDSIVIMTWINSVLIAFFIESGPSLLAKAHWEPNLDPQNDFIRAFLVCNQWNAYNYATKAFCNTDEDGLQIRAEYVTDIGAGLNDNQLSHQISLAIHHLLKTIDHLSKEISGSTAVEWPNEQH
ncbi:Putative bacterial sensory transduction regulator [Corynebacterium kutscheri]|uniref:Putative bacterial sensory transduction regulator n=1 Tax=Corynebacterium kutscheri TaxID=35755 RepID=A0A0F6R2A8_9CORY|nr:YbjN domain-containing protein [Corynebacterium kutscheri]AKE41523.1 Putative bacterial sensory transduction regulator [Corynebacterium kutscheri]VEH08801.1 Uncharacterised protein [Corynebacterium kutscheri]VEH09847.1 Uncharacterised protein [Corynebacterium kutscheri]